MLPDNSLMRQNQKNRMLRKENEELREKIANLASINEVLIAETRVSRAKQSDSKVIDLSVGKL